MKFNTLKNEWKEFLILPKELSFNSSKIVFNNVDNTLYIGTYDVMNSGDDQIIAMNITTKEYKKITLANIAIGHLLLENNNLHIIGCSDSNHSVIEQNKAETQTLCNYSHFIGDDYFACHRSVYLKKQEKIYTFGGWICGGNQYLTEDTLDTILSYDLKTKEHKLLDLKIPKGLDSFGYIKTNDERFVIIFGGDGDEGISNHDIYIFDMDENTV